MARETCPSSHKSLCSAKGGERSTDTVPALNPLTGAGVGEVSVVTSPWQFCTENVNPVQEGGEGDRSPTWDGGFLDCLPDLLYTQGQQVRMVTSQPRSQLGGKGQRHIILAK